jgi:hypothetical protein
MNKYFKIYLQKEADGAEVKETIADFGMYCMEYPFVLYSEVKDVTKRSWYDEDGDDEYIPENGQYIQSYENSVKFGFKGEEFGANEKLRSFLDYLRSGMMKMYCEFNKVGRQHIRFKSVKQTLCRDKNDGDLLVVTVTFKFNDPVTDIEPTTDASGNVTKLS